MLRSIEAFLSKVWPFLFVCLFLLAASCRYSEVVTGPDGRPAVVVKGEDKTGLQPNEVLGVPAEDVVGAAKDAVETVNPVEVVEKGRRGDWFGVVAGVLTFVAMLVGGIGVRRKIRKKKGAM